MRTHGDAYEDPEYREGVAGQMAAERGERRPAATHPESLSLAARKVDAAWTRYVEVDEHECDEFERVAEAIGELRAVLDGCRVLTVTRTGMRPKTGDWLTRCQCGWRGQPFGRWWLAVTEFTAHRCGDRGTR